MALETWKHRRSRHYHHSKRKHHRKRHIVPTHQVFKQLDAPWPDEVTVKLDYRSAYIGVETKSTKALTQMRGNGPFDPDVALGGSTPRGWDQFTSRYGYYFCAGSGCIVRTRPIENLADWVAALWPADSTAATTGTPYKDGERAYSRFGRGVQGIDQLVLKQYMTTKKMYGLESARIQEDYYSAAVTGLPVSQWYWNFSYQNADLANSVIFTTDFHVIYYITFYSRKDPAPTEDDDEKSEKKEPPPPPKPHNVTHVWDLEKGQVVSTDLLTGKVFNTTSLKKDPKKVSSKK